MIVESLCVNFHLADEEGKRDALTPGFFAKHDASEMRACVDAIERKLACNMMRHPSEPERLQMAAEMGRAPSWPKDKPPDIAGWYTRTHTHTHPPTHLYIHTCRMCNTAMLNICGKQLGDECGFRPARPSGTVRTAHALYSTARPVCPAHNVHVDCAQDKQNPAKVAQFKLVEEFYLKWDARLLDQDVKWKNLNPGNLCVPFACMLLV
jgi:hypothetical protein